MAPGCHLLSIGRTRRTAAWKRRARMYWSLPFSSAPNTPLRLASLSNPKKGRPYGRLELSKEYQVSLLLAAAEEQQRCSTQASQREGGRLRDWVGAQNDRPGGPAS